MLRIRSLTLAYCLLCAPLLGGCAGEGAPEVRRETEPCAKVKALAKVLGCSGVQECVGITEGCADEANAMLDCASEDISQCLCESGDGQLNCEGAWKPSEGPARCVEPYSAFRACTGP